MLCLPSDWVAEERKHRKGTTNPDYGMEMRVGQDELFTDPELGLADKFPMDIRPPGTYPSISFETQTLNKDC